MRWTKLNGMSETTNGRYIYAIQRRIPLINPSRFLNHSHTPNIIHDALMTIKADPGKAPSEGIIKPSIGIDACRCLSAPCCLDLETGHLLALDAFSRCKRGGAGDPDLLVNILRSVVYSTAIKPDFSIVCIMLPAIATQVIRRINRTVAPRHCVVSIRFIRQTTCHTMVAMPWTGGCALHP